MAESQLIEREGMRKIASYHHNNNCRMLDAKIGRQKFEEKIGCLHHQKEFAQRHLLIIKGKVLTLNQE